MRIAWAENPLETRVELDAADRLLLRAKLKVEYLEDRIVSAYFELTPKHTSHVDADARVVRAAQILDIDYVLDDEARDGKTLTEWLEAQAADYEQELLGKHVGDCTCVPCSCTKCHAENMLGVDTVRGLGKHSAYKIDSAFANGASIHEAVERLANYKPTHDPASSWPREDWEKHVPRWIEEGKRAHAWLAAYRDEHFAGGAR
jgi:hypothetical protein